MVLKSSIGTSTDHIINMDHFPACHLYQTKGCLGPMPSTVGCASASDVHMEQETQFVGSGAKIQDSSNTKESLRDEQFAPEPIPIVLDQCILWCLLILIIFSFNLFEPSQTDISDKLHLHTYSFVVKMRGKWNDFIFQRKKDGGPLQTQPLNNIKDFRSTILQYNDHAPFCRDVAHSLESKLAWATCIYFLMISLGSSLGSGVWLKT